MRRSGILLFAILSLPLSHCASATPQAKRKPKAVARKQPVVERPIDAAVIAPPPPTATTTTATLTAILEPPPPPPPPPPPKKEHFSVLMIGDSMAATDFGSALEKQLDAHGKITCIRRGKSATGLARPDFFDWMAEGAKQVKRHSPELVLVIIGGNDGQDLIGPKGKKKGRVFWKGSEWREAYRARVQSFLDMLVDDGRRVLWLELPLMDHKSLEEKLSLIRAVQKTAVEHVDGASWLDTRRYFVDRKGRLVRKTKVDGWRRPQRLRQEDGIHFTVAGAHFFAARVYPEVLSALGL